MGKNQLNFFGGTGLLEIILICHINIWNIIMCAHQYVICGRDVWEIIMNGMRR